MVATAYSSKKRFQLLATNGVLTHIRATQGHSTSAINPIKLFTRVTEVANWYYHGTFYLNIQDILFYGLAPGGQDQDNAEDEASRAYTHLSPYLPRDRRCMAGMRKNTPVVLQLDAHAARDEVNAEFWVSASGAILTDDVLPGWLIRNVTESHSGLVLYDRQDIVEEWRYTGSRAWTHCPFCSKGKILIGSLICFTCQKPIKPAEHWAQLREDDAGLYQRTADSAAPHAATAMAGFAQLLGIRPRGKAGYTFRGGMTGAAAARQQALKLEARCRDRGYGS
jgi:RNA:NAD 2'-phosphotransferase (TPT1/KptA family)